MSVPDALDKYTGAQRLCLEGVRKKFTNLEEAMVYAEELTQSAAEVHHNEALAISQSAQIMKVLSHPVRYLSVTVGQDLTPEAGQTPMELGLMK
jgi:hypothetical protein